MADQFSKYGAKWTNRNALAIELACIRRGGRWQVTATKQAGLGLEAHIRNAISLFAPEFWWNRWADMALTNYVENREIVLAGCASSGKSTFMALAALVEYWSFPNGTSIVASSTSLKMLQKRIWGEIMMRFNHGRKIHPWLPGQVIGSANAIFTDVRDSETSRDERNGIFGIACRNSTGKDVGLGSYSGLKNQKVRLFADEGSYMSNEFLNGSANLNANDNYKMVVSGNPSGTRNALGIISEPAGGWSSIAQTDRSQVWVNRRSRSVTVQYVGFDSPALDFEVGKCPAPLINRRFIDDTITNYGINSMEVAREVKGHIMFGENSRVVITDDLCQTYGAKEPPSWSSAPVKVCGSDISYAGTGGDDTVLAFCSFGTEVSGKRVFCVDEIVTYIKQVSNEDPAVLTARFAKTECERRGIPPNRFIFDGSGRSTFTTAVMREWSTQVIPLEFGGKPTSRQFGKIICNERYDKFVSELWFSVRECIMSRQFRGITKDLIDEGSSREYVDMAQGGFVKNSVVPKEKMKEILGFSPDRFDALVCALELARRLGFQIESGVARTQTKGLNWLELAAKDARETLAEIALSYGN